VYVRFFVREQTGRQVGRRIGRREKGEGRRERKRIGDYASGRCDGKNYYHDIRNYLVTDSRWDHWPLHPFSTEYNTCMRTN
jgi:hypothetical protein